MSHWGVHFLLGTLRLLFEDTCLKGMNHARDSSSERRKDSPTLGGRWGEE